MMLLFGIYDRTAQQIVGQIMQHKIAAPAIRDFNYALGMKDTTFGRFPEQYELWQLGYFDEEKGIISSEGFDYNAETGELTMGKPRTIATGEAWKAAHQEEPAKIKRA